MKITQERQWQSYEEVAAFLLRRFAEHFALGDVEGKQLVPGNSGTNWEIDAKGVREDGAGFIIVECRRYTKSRIKQESMAGLAYRIQDTGAQGGILVTPIGFQEGAARIASHENIHEVQLDPASTTHDYVLRFLDHVAIGVSAKINIQSSVSLKVYDKDGNLKDERQTGPSS